MTRPYIICHMLQSIDGKISGDFFNMPATRSLLALYRKMSDEFNADAIIYGSITANEIFTDDLHLDLNTVQLFKNEKEDYILVNEKTKWVIVIDPTGSVGWTTEALQNQRLKDKNVIEVLCENVSSVYLSHLQKIGVSYILCGKDQLDLFLAVNKLKEKFKIDRILLQGGGIVNSSFASVGLIDEVSLILSPVMDVKTKGPLTFEHHSLMSVSARTTDFILKDSKVLVDSGIWLDYIKRE